MLMLQIKLLGLGLGAAAPPIVVCAVARPKCHPKKVAQWWRINGKHLKQKSTKNREPFTFENLHYH